MQGWQFVSPKKIFTFPDDTIISAGKKIIFANAVTGMDSDAVALESPIGKSFAAVDAAPVFVAPTSSPIATGTPMSLADIQAKINDVKNKLALLSPQLESSQSQSQLHMTAGVAIVSKSNPPTMPTNVSEQNATQNIKENDSENNSENSQSANVIQAFATSSQTSIVGGILSWPMRGFNFIKHLFVEN